MCDCPKNDQNMKDRTDNIRIDSWILKIITFMFPCCCYYCNNPVQVANFVVPKDNKTKPIIRPELATTCHVASQPLRCSYFEQNNYLAIYYFTFTTTNIALFMVQRVMTYFLLLSISVVSKLTSLMLLALMALSHLYLAFI